MQTSYDVIVIGAGLPGGLPATAYVQKAGRVRSKTKAEYSTLLVWRAPVHMPPDCLVPRLVVACDTPSTSSAEQSASSRTSSFSSFASDGARTDTASTSHTDKGWHPRRMF